MSVIVEIAFFIRTIAKGHIHALAAAGVNATAPTSRKRGPFGYCLGPR